MTDLHKLAYEKEMQSVNQDPSRGAKFEAYQDAMMRAKSDGKCITNPSQLQSRVGGKYQKARIAFDVLSSEIIEQTEIRDIPSWFLDQIETAFKVDVDKLWREVDCDISSIVNSRIKVAQIDKDRCEKNLAESDSLIDNLQEQLESYDDLRDKYDDLVKQNEELKRRNESFSTQLLEQEKKIDLSFEIERKLVASDIKKEGLQERNSRLEIQLNEFNQSYQDILIKNAQLEGRILQMQEFQQ